MRLTLGHCLLDAFLVGAGSEELSLTEMSVETAVGLTDKTKVRNHWDQVVLSKGVQWEMDFWKMPAQWLDWHWQHLSWGADQGQLTAVTGEEQLGSALGQLWL